MKKIDIKKSIIYSRDNIIYMNCNFFTKKGYFSNDKDFTEYTEGYLNDVRFDKNGIHFSYLNRNRDRTFITDYFIPEEQVAFKEETKYRPYKDIFEFCNETGCEEVGVDAIIIRNKNSKQESTLLYTGYSNYAVHLGGYVLAFDDLLSDYEYALSSSEWQPFGIME